MRFLLFLLFASFLYADTIKLIGDNRQPGFLALQDNGITYQALDYTHQRYSSQGDVWQANVFTYGNLLTEGYYGPSDPSILYTDYLDRYKMDFYLFKRLLTDTNQDQVQRIQDGVYYLSTGGTNWNYNDYVAQAHNAYLNGQLPSTLGFYIVDSPLTDSTLKQGFLYYSPPTGNHNPTPEPGSLLLIVGASLVFIGSRRNSLRTR
jgi:hypothetical protein